MARHLDLQPKLDVASFRKIAIGTWPTAYDPTVYGTLTVRLDQSAGQSSIIDRSSSSLA